MKKVIASAGLVALGAVGIQTAHADMVAGPDKPWVVSGTLRGFYDDNYNTQPDGPGRVGSWGFEIRPSGSYKYTEGPTALTVGYTYSLKDYTDRPGNQIDQAHEFDLTFNHSFSDRYTLDLEESFVSSQEPEVLNGSAPGSAPLRANGDNLHNSIGINFHDQVTKLFGVVAGYNNGWLDYTGNQTGATAGQPSYGTLLNSLIHTFSLDGTWMIDDETTGILEYKFLYTDYLSNNSINTGPPFIAAQTRNSYQHIVDVGIMHSFRPDFGVNAHVGIEASDYYNYTDALGVGANPSTVTPYADLSVNYNYTDGGMVTLAFKHATTQTDVGVDLANHSLTVNAESSTVSLNVVQVLKPVSPDLTLTANLQYQDSVFNGGGFNGQGEDFYSLGFNFAYQFMHNFSGEVGYNYDLLDSGLGGRGYDRNRVYVGLTATY